MLNQPVAIKSSLTPGTHNPAFQRLAQASDIDGAVGTDLLFHGDYAFEDYQNEEDVEGTIKPVTDQSASELESLIMHEVQKQRGTICGDLGSLSSRPAVQRMEDIWGCQADVFEASTMAQLDLTEDDISTSKGTLLRMLKRQYQMLESGFLRQNPPPKDTSSRSYSHHRETASRNTLALQLAILQGWTEGWEQAFAAGIFQPQSPEAGQRDVSQPGMLKASINAQAGPTSHYEPEDLHSLQTSHEHHHGQGIPWLDQSDNSAALHGTASQLMPPQPKDMYALDKQNIYHGFQAQDEWDIHRSLWQSDHHAQQVGYGHMGLYSEQQVGLAHGVIQGAHITPGFLQMNDMSNTAAVTGSTPFGAVAPDIIPPSIQAQLSGTASNTQSSIDVGNQLAARKSGRVQPTKRRRGKPRKRMFIQAPLRDTPLPPLADEDEILQRFPEHLSLTDVMRRFVRSSTTRPGGVTTRDMMEVLLQHANARDFDGITEEQREANVHRWIVKEKDACNRALCNRARRPSSAGISQTRSLNSAVASGSARLLQ